jgi:MFS transporter, UMF1 family
MKLRRKYLSYSRNQPNHMQTASKKVINSWALYDWANSVYSLVITSTIFPAYYDAVTKGKLPNNEVKFLGRTFVNTALYDYALAFAFIIVAIMSPILSSIADLKGNKRSFMRFFCTMGSIACCTMYFFDYSTLWLGILCLIVACVGFWGSLVFYNAYLPEIAAPADQDRVSAKGFSMGYTGSVLLQIISFLFVLKPELFGITDLSFPARLSFLMVGIWWFGFAQIPLRVLPKSPPSAEKNNKNIFTNGFLELKKVWNQVMKMPVLKRYLGAFFFYNMGVQTVMLAATLFGSKELQMPPEKLIITILIIQLVAILGAVIMSKLSGKFGNLQVLCGVVVIWIGICIAAYMVTKETQFYALAAVVGLVMGGIQSLSRSTYSKLMPETRDTASFFSFYDVTEKIAIVIGMLSFGLIEELSGSMRNSVLAIMVFFIIGLLLLFITLGKQKQLSR